MGNQKELDETSIYQSLAMGTRNARIYHDAVRPVWSADGCHFSYRCVTPEGVRYFLVSPESGTRTSLFDTERLVSGLGTATGETRISLEALKDVALSLDGESVEFAYAAKRWKLALAGHDLDELGPVENPGERMSPNGEFRLVAKQDNLWVIDLEGNATALTTDGNAERTYDFQGFLSSLAQASAQLPPRQFGHPILE